MPADSDVLAVCGRPLPQLEEATGQAWHQMPGPRVRVDVEDAARVAESLDHARARLLAPGIIAMTRRAGRSRLTSSPRRSITGRWTRAYDNRLMVAK